MRHIISVLLEYINGKWLDREERQERIDLLIEHRQNVYYCNKIQL